MYQECKGTFKHEEYCIDNETAIIGEDGFMNIEWTAEMNDYDFLIATPTVPKPKKVLTAEEIADRMLEKKYFEYFDNNVTNGIATFQDDKIKQRLGR
jgi:hypothetical protein